MAITYYPGETFKQRTHVVEQLQQPNVLQSVSGAQDLNGAALSASLWCPKGWEVRRVSMAFSAATSKNYSIAIVRGVGVITGKNDRLWIKVDGAPAIAVIVPQGFYTGATLATALQTAINNTAFLAASLPFSVSYDASNGEFTIAPASGNAKVLANNTTTRVRIVSTLAPLIGFTVDTDMTTSLTSDTGIVGLGTSFAYLSAAASASQAITGTDILAMTIDHKLQIDVSSVSGADVASYDIVYKVLDA